MNFKLKRLGYGLYLRTASIFRQNKTICKWLYGVLPPDRLFGDYWDWTTLLLRKLLYKTLKPEMSFLDMGTGPYGILSYYAALKLHCTDVTGVDYLQEMVTSANQQIPGHRVKFICRDLLSGLDRCFDIIAFNAPYKHREDLHRFGDGVDELSQFRWYGGIETISRFLQELPPRLNPEGKCYLGINLFHFRYQNIEKLITGLPLEISDIKHNHFTHSCIYIIRRKR